MSISADKGAFPLLSMSPHHQPGIPKLSMRLQLPTCQSAAPTRLQTGQAHRHGEQLRLALRKVPSRHVLDKPRRHTSGLAAESLDLLFLSCLIASGTLSLKAEAKHSLHLKDVCWLKEGGLLGGGAGSRSFHLPHSARWALCCPGSRQSWQQDFSMVKSQTNLNSKLCTRQLSSHRGPLA